MKTKLGCMSEPEKNRLTWLCFTHVYFELGYYVKFACFE